MALAMGDGMRIGRAGQGMRVDVAGAFVLALACARAGVGAVAAAAPAAAGGGAAIGAAGVEDAAGGPAARWRVLDEWPSRGELASAVAESARGGLAVGDAAGVSWWRAGAWSRAQTPAVRDLAFDGAGRLWIGTEEGLFGWDPAARPERRRLRDGDASNHVSRLEANAGALVVATEGGLYWSSSGRIFQTLNAGSADQAVAWVALRRIGGASAERALPRSVPAAATATPAAEQVEIWSLGVEGLVQLRGIESADGLRVVGRSLWPLPRPAAEAGAVDLVIPPSGAQLFVVYPDAIAALALETLSIEEVVWRWARPVLPPGAQIRRLVARADGGLWLATDHGLLESDGLDRAFARASSPAGLRACGDVLEADRLPGGARAIALCQPSLLALVNAATPLADAASEAAAPIDALAGLREPAATETASRAPAPAVATNAADADRPAPIALPADPPVAEIRSRALERVGLSVGRAESLWRGLRRKAYWPSLELRGLYDADEDRGRTHDQTFVSGDFRNLLDRDRAEASHYAATVVFDWELGGIAYPDDSVDLSRELRQVTSLRDDVSDEIHQIYFERQRIRARLAQAELLAPGEALELQLRAEELESGLDAWTGGWLRAWRGANATAAPIAHPGRLDRSTDPHPESRSTHAFEYAR